MKSPVYLTLVASLATGVFVSYPVAASENWRARVSAEEAVTMNDVAAEVVFGREIAARILGRYKPYNDQRLIKYVSLVGASLLRNTNRSELDFHFTVLDTDDINAYAAPGGYVFVTRGALMLMKDENELAGVLAHEIGHITGLHVVKELKLKGVDDSVTTGLARLVGGSSESARSAFAQAVDKGFDMVFKDGYKRSDEMQADGDAVIVCALSGYDASGLARYLERVRSVKGELPETTQTEQTHPSYEARIAQINSIISANGIVPEGQPNQKRFDMAMKLLSQPH